MITQSDDGQDFDPDDPLTVILRPGPDYLGLPPGRYEKIRRGAARRRMLRIAAGVGVSCAVAALVLVPLKLAGPGSPTAPAGPLRPPPAGSPSTGPAPAQRPAPGTTRPVPDDRSTARTRPTTPADPTVRPQPTTQGPTRAPTTRAMPTRGAPTKSPTDAPTAGVPTSDAPTSEAPTSYVSRMAPTGATDSPAVPRASYPQVRSAR